MADLIVKKNNINEVSKPVNGSEISFGKISFPKPIKPIFDFKAYKSVEKVDLSEGVRTKEDVVKITGYRRGFIDDIMRNEGFKLNAYSDAADKKTIGIGHNISADKNYKYDDLITEEQAYKLLAKDLLNVRQGLNERLCGAKISRGQFEALSDLAFNVGVGALDESKLLSYIKEGKFKRASGEFNFISCGKSGVNTGLCIRRIRDINKFCEDGHSAVSVYSMEKIKEKGLLKFNHIIKKASFIKKGYYMLLKRSFKNEATTIITKARRDVNSQK